MLDRVLDGGKMKRRVRVGLFVFLLLYLPWVTFAQEPQPVDLSYGHYPMILSGIGPTEAHFNLLFPRNKTYRFEAQPLVEGGGALIHGQLAGTPIHDPKGILHDHVLKVSFKGLEPGTRYELRVVELFRGDESVVDRREFSSWDDSKSELRFATGSCISDEMRYEAARQGVVRKMLERKPELIVLMGDQVYVDAFDYIERGKVSEYDIWARNFRAFQTNPLFRSRDLVPTIVTWDDHDTGVDNGNRHTPTIGEARKAFFALFGSPDVPGFSSNAMQEDQGVLGVYRIVSLRGQHFVLLDNRSFRAEPERENQKSAAARRFDHLGSVQEMWLLDQLKNYVGFFWLVSGDMWGSEPVMKEHGPKKAIAEGFWADHPTQYRAVMDAIHGSGVAYALISGDIHFTQLVSHGPEWMGTPRHAPFPTIEITASPLASILFQPKEGQPEFWPDAQRIAAVRGYGFVQVNVAEAVEGIRLEIQAHIVDQADPAIFHQKTILMPPPRKDQCNEVF